MQPGRLKEWFFKMSQLLITYSLELAIINADIDTNRGTLMQTLEGIVKQQMIGVDGIVDVTEWSINSPTPFLLSSIQDIASGLEQGLNQTQDQYLSGLISQINIVKSRNDILIGKAEQIYVETGDWLLNVLGVGLGVSNYILEQINQVYTQDLEAEASILDLKIVEGMMGVSSLIGGYVEVTMDNIIDNIDNKLYLVPPIFKNTNLVNCLFFCL